MTKINEIKPCCEVLKGYADFLSEHKPEINKPEKKKEASSNFEKMLDEAINEIVNENKTK